MQQAGKSVGRGGFTLLIWVLLLLLGCVLFFFSLDRQIVSILKTTLMQELGLDNSDYSVLISAFMIPYTFMYFFVGGIVDRFGSRYVLCALMVLMSLATLITGLSHSMIGLITGRVLLGLAESGIVPALTLAEVGKLMWLPPLVAVFGVLAVCWASDRLVARGMDATRARLTIIWSVTCLAPLVFLLPSISNAWAAVAIMTVINFMCTAWLSMATIMMGGLAPRVAIATAIGVMSALGGVTSIIFNGFVGSIIDHFGYSMPIYAGATLHPIGALVLAAFFLRRKKTFIARPETV